MSGFPKAQCQKKMTKISGSTVSNHLPTQPKTKKTKHWDSKYVEDGDFQYDETFPLLDI